MNIDWELTAQELAQSLSLYKLIDVRTTEEFFGHEGHIAGSRLVTLGPDFEHFLNSVDPSDSYIFICRSGIRSWQATLNTRAHGIQAYNLKGGIMAWNKYTQRKL